MKRAFDILFPLLLGLGLLALWQSVTDKAHFPIRYLIKAKQTLADFATNHDHNYRNANQG